MLCGLAAIASPFLTLRAHIQNQLGNTPSDSKVDRNVADGYAGAPAKGNTCDLDWEDSVVAKDDAVAKDDTDGKTAIQIRWVYGQRQEQEQRQTN